MAAGDRIAVLQSPREVMKRLEVLRGIMFSTQTGGGFGVAPTVHSGPSSPRLLAAAANQATPALRRSRKPRGKHLPPLSSEDYNTGDCMSCNLVGQQNDRDERSGYRINSFYQAPIGDENF